MKAENPNIEELAWKIKECELHRGFAELVTELKGGSGSRNLRLGKQLEDLAQKYDVTFDRAGKSLNDAAAYELKYMKNGEKIAAIPLFTAWIFEHYAEDKAVAAFIREVERKHLEKAKAEEAQDTDSMDWGLVWSAPLTLENWFYLVEMSDRNQKPNDGSGKIPVFVNIRVRVNNQVKVESKRYKFGFSKVHININNLNPTKAELEFNRNFWGAGRDCLDARINLFGDEHSGFLELEARSDSAPLNNHYRREDDKEVFTVKSNSLDNDGADPKVGVALWAHMTDMVLEPPDDVELDEVQTALIGRLIEKDQRNGQDAVNANNDHDDRIILSSHTAVANCQPDANTGSF